MATVRTAKTELSRWPCMLEPIDRTKEVNEEEL